jgi:hypothetical protein
MLIEDMYVLIINQGLRILNGDFLMNELEWRACFRSRQTAGRIGHKCKKC